MKILIVEDDINTLRGMTELLLHEGYITLPASNAADAGEIFKRENPEIVLSDYKLQESNGIELCRLFQQTNPSVIQYLFTAYSNPEIVRDAYDLGIREVFSKPIDLDRLFSCLEKHQGQLVERHAELF